MTSDQDFKGTPLFVVDYLRNGTRQTYSYNDIDAISEPCNFAL